jgi:hypothetical protein
MREEGGRSRERTPNYGVGIFRGLKKNDIGLCKRKAKRSSQLRERYSDTTRHATTIMRVGL